MTWASPMLALIATASVLGGCCSDRSLIKSDMSDALVESKVKAELRGVTDLQERFKVVAQMVDWSEIQARDLDPLVRWNADTRSMRIPVSSGCYLGYTFSNHDAVIRFDEDGEVVGVNRDWRRYEPLESKYGKAFEQIPAEVTEAGGIRVLGATGDGLERTSFVISDTFPDLNRAIQINYYTTFDSEYAGSVGAPTISTDPPVAYRVVEANGPFVEMSPLYDAYIVQLDDIAARSGSWKPYLPIQQTPFPKYEMYYQCLLLLEPHDGVVLSIGLEGSQ